ncbi:MAG TPA: putative Ig domain-containing protein [Candidatus Acidoferrum sp.]|nr:putative Ig domain-containing protein [Candidatus Acidoferrum sp.]
MTNARRPEVATRLSLVAVLTLAAMFSVGLLPAHAQVSSLPIQFSDVSIFATNSVRIDNGARVTSGHVVVNNASPGNMLVPSFELGLNNNARTPAGYAVVADSLKLSNGAVVSGNAFFNNLSNSGTISGTQNTPLGLPVFTPLPTFKSAPAGTVDVTVPNGGVQTIAAGNYRDITVSTNATLRIDQGVTNVRSITVSTGGKLLFLNLTSGPSEVRVAEQMSIGNGFVVGPVDSDPLKAGKIVFYVASPSTTTVAVDTGTGGTLYANVYAPNGTLVLDNGTTAVGAFLAKNVDVQNGSTVGLESFFAQQAPAITSADATTFTVGQAGTFTVTTTGFPTPSITRGGAALPSGVTFTDNGNGTGTLSGTPAAGTGGTYAITFTASNGVPPDAVQNFTLTIKQAPTITSANATTFTVGTAGSFTVTTAGFPAPSISRGGAALPSGVTFIDNGNGTGTLSGTPAAGTGGTYAITFTATNTSGSSPTQSFTLTVNQAPAITSANATTFIVGQAGSFTVTTTGFPTPSIAQGGALPAGVTFTNNGNGTGTLSGTPAAGSAGTYAITFTASNGVSPNAVQNFTLTVAQAPVITSANATTFTVGQLGSFTVTTTGFPPPSIAQGGTLPAGVTFTSNGDGTGTLSGTPAAGTGGAYAITFTATNVAGSSPTQNFTLTVNQAPAITSANTTTFTVGQPGSFTVTTTGFPTPSIAQGGALPAGVTFTNNGNGTGTLSGTPAAGSGGVYPLTFTASNGVPPNAVQNFTLGVNAPPSAVNDGPYLTDANTTFSRATSDPDDLLDNDSLGFPVATLTSFGGGSLGGSVTSNAAGATATFGTGGSLTVQSNGAFTFTPETGFTGAFTFEYRLTNAGGTSDATVTIHVRPKATLDVFPENVVGNVVVNTATGTVFSVLTNDVYNGSVTVTGGASSTNGGTVTINPSTGTFTYDPPVGFQGSDSFTYTITDSSGFTSAPAAVSVTVSGMIWFVNNNSGACSSACDGRMTHPFTTLQAFTGVNDGAGTHPANNQNIFVYESATSYTFASGTLLRTGQKLIGQDATATLASIAGVTPPSGSSLPAMNTGGNATTIGSTVPLAANSTVRGLSVSTGASPGVSGGAVSGVSISETRVTTTVGTAVSLNGTGGTLSFTSVSSNGAVNGINIANTSGSFTVTGDGGGSNNGSGGAIQSSTGHGVTIATAANVSLGYMNIQNSGDAGIRGTGITNFTLDRSNVTNNGNSASDDGVQLGDVSGSTVGATGTVTISNSNVSGNAHNNVHIRNTSGTISSLVVSNSTFNNLNDTFGNNSFLFEASGTSTVTGGSITGNTFSANSPQRGLEVQAHDTATVGTLTVSGNAFNDNGIHASFTQDGSANLTFKFLNNGTLVSPMLTATLSAVNVFSSATSTGGTVVGTISGNFIGNPAIIGSGSASGNGIRVLGQGRTAMTLRIDGNTVHQTPQARAIDLQFLGSTTAGLGIVSTNDVTITNNFAATDGTPVDFPLAAIFLAADNQGSPARVRADVRGNTVPIVPNTYDYPTFDGTAAHLIYVELSGATAELVDNAPASPDATAELQSHNTGAVYADPTISLIAGPIVTPP